MRRWIPSRVAGWALAIWSGVTVAYVATMAGFVAFVLFRQQGHQAISVDFDFGAFAKSWIATGPVLLVAWLVAKRRQRRPGQS